MRSSIMLIMLCLSFAASADEYQTVTILDAGAHQGPGGNALFGGQNMMNMIKVQLGDMLISAEYPTIANGKNAASNLVVGTQIQAKLDGAKMEFVLPTGKVVKARIVRRELATTAPSGAAAGAEDLSNAR